MPADALNYRFVASELNDALQNGRIDKITMPENDEIVLGIRAGGKNRALLLSANPANPRCHLTCHSLSGPAAAPAFLMHLRKHIGGANVVAVRSVPYERILEIDLSAKNELGFPENKKLIVEVMGKYSNIILVNADGRISDCIKHVTPDTSSKRQVMPGLIYRTAPAQEKITVSQRQELLTALETFDGVRLDNFLLRRLSGLAPASITEAVFDALGTQTAAALSPQSRQAVVKALDDLYNGPEAPCIHLEGGEQKDFAFRPYKTLGERILRFETLNEAMDAFYFESDRKRRLTERSRTLTSALKNAVSRTEKKLAEFRRRQSEAADLERDRLCGELITANIYRIKQGQRYAECENYYADPPESVRVELDETKSPQFNAQRYFKKYAKKKKTLEVLKTQVELAERDLDYYLSISESFRLLTDLKELDEIADELTKAGVVAPKKAGKGAAKRPQPSAPARIEYEGYAIDIGHNNVQNDRLTKSAAPDDVWLHTQKTHGAHVVIRNPAGGEIPSAVVAYAASLAAYNSKAYLSDNVPVDYTQVRYVSKPHGAPPGKVVYTNQRSVFVTPRKE